MSQSDDMPALIAQLDAVRAAKTPRAAFDVFAERMCAHGFISVFAGRLSLALLTDLSPEPFAFLNAHEAMLAHYLREELFANDPVMARARIVNRPFRWRDVRDGSLSPEQLAVMEFFAQTGFSHGLCVPIDRVRGVNGVVSLGRSSDFTLSPSAMIAIEMLSRTLFETCDRHYATHAQPVVNITQRERDVLTLVAQGKTNWEAGQILGVSEYSIRDYLRALSRKLQTTNRTHTVVRAMQLGLIAV